MNQSTSIPPDFFFFLSGFFTDTDESQDSRRREGTIFYSTLPLTCLLTFKHLFCNFEMTITYFKSHRLYLPGFYSMRYTTLSNYYLIDWWCELDLCLFTCWFDSRILSQLFDTENRWTQTRIGYYLCIQGII